ARHQDGGREQENFGARVGVVGFDDDFLEIYSRQLGHQPSPHGPGGIVLATEREGGGDHESFLLLNLFSTGGTAGEQQAPCHRRLAPRASHKGRRCFTSLIRWRATRSSRSASSQASQGWACRPGTACSPICRWPGA